MKWKIILLLMVVLPSIYALDLCEDKVQINTNCTMITPFLSGCSAFNYSIYNATEDGNMGGLVDNGDLTSINASTYYFNFTEKEGKYVIQLCDGTTRLVQVTNNGDNTVLGIIILMPLLLAFLFIFIAHSMSGDEHPALKLFFMLLSLMTVFTAWQYGMIVLVDFFGQTQLTDAMAISTQIYSYIFYVILTYFCIYLVVKVSQYIMQKKKERFQY